MKKNFLHFTAVIVLLSGFASCDRGDDDDDNPTPTVTYNCDGGRQAYLEMTINGNDQGEANGSFSGGNGD